MPKDKKKVLSVNRRAYLRFEILEISEAGIELTGSEVKSAKMGNMNLSNAYALIRNSQCLLLNCHIAPYPFDSLGFIQHNPTRDRKLLLHKHEILRLANKISAKGLTLVPVEAYVTAKSRIKISIGLARGKKGPDRKEDIKKKDLERELRGKYKYRL